MFLVRPTATSMAKQFISAAIEPVPGTIEINRMSIGEPGLPRQFRWGSQTIQIVQVLRSWRETGPCRHGSGERYARKHWFEVLLNSEDRADLYFERQARSGRNNSRWWLHTIESGADHETSI